MNYRKKQKRTRISNSRSSTATTTGTNGRSGCVLLSLNTIFEAFRAKTFCCRRTVKSAAATAQRRALRLLLLIFHNDNTVLSFTFDVKKEIIDSPVTPKIIKK